LYWEEASCFVQNIVKVWTQLSVANSMISEKIFKKNLNCQISIDGSSW
jgi:hypothetical protein